MRNRFIAGFTLASFLALGIPVLADPGPLAQAKPALTGAIEAQVGQVFLLDGRGGPSSEVSPVVRPGATYRTGGDGELVVVFPNGSRVRVSPESEFQVVKMEAGATELQLHRGRILGSAQNGLQIKTAKSALRANLGEFVLETSEDGAGLRVFSGDARLDAVAAEPTTYESLSSVPKGSDLAPLLNLPGVNQEQLVGDFEFGGAKGKGVRVRTSPATESVGGIEDASPDQDIISPGPKPAPPVVADPPVTPPVSPPPAAAGPPAAAPAATVTGGGIGPWGFIGAGLGLAGLVVALTNDDDGESAFLVGPVPSPSLP